jgi:hypothetical protein
MTGSGKSTFAIWLFAESADFHRKPWTILDFKGEDIIGEGLTRKLFALLPIEKDIPEKPGIYVVRHDPLRGQDPVINFLWRIYQRGKIGLFLDEATMVPELRGEANSGGPFQSILSQGRSKEIPVYTLAQRPVNVNRMVYTENQFYSAFRLKSKDDLKKVKGEIPEDSKNYQRVWGEDVTLRKFWSRWYDVERDTNYLLRPSPTGSQSLDIIKERLENARSKEAV